MDILAARRDSLFGVGGSRFPTQMSEIWYHGYFAIDQQIDAKAQNLTICIEYYKEHYMMQKRTLYSLLLISFIVVFAASMSVAQTVTIESKSNLPRCAEQAVEINADVTTDVAAVEFVFEISTASGCGFIENLELTWELADGVLSNRTALDLSQADGVAPDTIRFAAMRVDDGDGVLAAGAQLVATLGFKTVDCCEGTASIDNTVFDYVNATCDITTQFVDAGDFSVIYPTVVASTLGMINQNPTIEAVDDATLAWSETYTTTLVGDDADLANGCESLTYSKVSGPSALSVFPDGSVSWLTTGADVGPHDVEVKVADACGGEALTSFNICVTNEAPTIACPDDQLMWYGETLNVQAVGTDADAGPHPMVYSLNSTTFPAGVVTVNAATGEIEVATDLIAEHTGFFQICVGVTDSANVDPECSPDNSDECCFQVEVRSMAVTIQKIHKQLQGHETTVSIDMLGADFNNWSLGGYDLLISYDQTALTFMGAIEGQFMLDCGWEYFTYREGYNGNCGNGCPSGIVRLVAMAEQNDGPNHPDCFNNDGDPTAATQLAELRFLVSNDRTFECMFVPVSFFWVDCGDNSFSDVGGDTLMISRDVYAYYGEYDMVGEVEVDTYVLVDEAPAFPGHFGAMECADYTAKGVPIHVVDFYNGGVDIICSDEIDAPGDINLNGIAYEIADAVMFTNYFIEGLSAFEHVEGSIAASDVNKDGVTLSVSDLVYMLRVVVGDAVPYEGKVNSVVSAYSYQDDVLSMGTELGGAYLVFEGNVDVQSLQPESVAKMRIGQVDGNTHVLVLSEDVTVGFSGNIVEAHGNLLSYEFATVAGDPIVAKYVPKNFKVNQNYPNPFNPTTTIAFDLPKTSAWTVGVYNIAGQLVETFSGQDEAGQIKVVWDASDLASGVYFYKVVAGSSTKTMKAVLLK